MSDPIAPGLVQLGDQFNQHRVTGWVPHAEIRGMDPRLDVALISQVTENFWQGGCMHDVELPAFFDFVLSLYPWEQYKLDPRTERLEVKMYDSLDQDTGQVDELADLLLDRIYDGQTVLVHCQAGLNRSGLIAAAVLVKQGMSPDDAIQHLRTNRCGLVLSNETFEDYVRTLA